ncbi:MAG: 5'-methylthioadenosine/adenosylhomocysteine nucleosidase [Lachnospiraceae bacterium]|jgi:adenosylhomocysteine nucleosidase|nr:5'-methylthioadenosine/adenosylhomocysteine nucleosidase [Lachnospiraceae bacterium]
MRIGIVCAGDSEVAPFLSMLNETSVTEKSLLKFYEGKIENRDVVTLFSGVCKVNAAIAVQILIDIYKCDIIINAGTAGGIDERLEIFDTVVSTEVAYHDVEEDILTDFHPWMPSVYFKADERLIVLAEKIANQLESKHKIFFGRMVTGEKFIEDEEREKMKAIYEPLSVDMESAAVAHVCYVNKVPFIAVRTITDTADHSGVDNFELNCNEASQLCADFVKMMLKEL